MLWQKDKDILSFINKFYCVKTSHIMQEFYNGCSQARYLACRKMTKLFNKGLVKRDRKIFQEYIYYFKKTRQQRHHLLVVDLYFKLKECGEVIKFEVEQYLGDIRPDAVVEILRGDNLYFLCFEVHISNNNYKISMSKYRDLYYSNKLDWFPIVVFISDKNLDLEDNDELVYYRVNENFANLFKIFIIK